MPNQVVWLDIPVLDLDRSIRFYSAVLGVEVKKESHGPDFSMGLFPHEGDEVGGCLAPADAENQPSAQGPLVYLNCQGRLEAAVAAVESHGGADSSDWNIRFAGHRARQRGQPTGFAFVLIRSRNLVGLCRTYWGLGNNSFTSVTIR